MTLPEVLLFIVITSICLTGVLGAFAAAERGHVTAGQMSQAEALAQERLEVIDGQYPVLGFACFNAPLFDPCQGASASPPCPGRVASAAVFCTAPTGYQVNTALTQVSAVEKSVEVTVTGPSGATEADLTQTFTQS